MFFRRISYTINTRARNKKDVNTNDALSYVITGCHDCRTYVARTLNSVNAI